ncbi:MAG TPA: flagellar export chaperone FliS [Rudaea sp.]|jgi:flagellar protein FliS|nr:flagellar export chaperone FliS [Rudaea sp.]
MARAQALLSQYRSVGTASRVNDASPHRLVALLLEGARDKIRTATAAIGCNQRARKATAIQSAYSILETLRITLDHRAGGEIAVGLDAIYEYCNRRLVEANAMDDVERLNEASSLLGEVQEAWSRIGATVQ